MVKTKKSIVKRFRITKNKKVLRRCMRQNHFNARDPGSKTRKKRRLKGVSSATKKEVIHFT